MKKLTYLTILFAFINVVALLSQSTETKSEKSFKLDLEFRPRSEYRHGYRVLMPDTSTAAFFTDQRARVNLEYKNSDFIFYASVQEIRTWGETDPRSTGGTLQAFEAYVEPNIFEDLKIRIGRQKIIYDNERLFAQNDWRQNGGSHDAVRLMYYKSNYSTDFIAAYNQERGANERFFETDFSPGFNNYKLLLTHFFNWKISDNFTLTTINALDGFQDTADFHLSHFRYTNGGRLEYFLDDWYFTVAAYLQHGETTLGGKLENAYYIQPEIKWKVNKDINFKLGAEVLSGTDVPVKNGVSSAFDPLYGVNHRFLGFMDYFIRFPGDYNEAGLVAPYFFTDFKIHRTLNLRVDAHVFLSHSDFTYKNEIIDKYLGFENDILLVYKPNDYTTLQVGYCYMLPTKSMEIIKKANFELSPWQDWAFIMVTFKPNILNMKL